MRRLRRAATVVAVLLVAAGLGLWLARDWPRRTVRAALADALAADVELAALEVRGTDDFVLHGLVVREPRMAPAVERVRIDTLAVRGSVGELRRGQARLLVASGGEVRLRATVPEAEPPPPSTSLAPSAGELRLDGFALTIGGDGDSGETTMTLDGQLAGELAGPTGTLRLSADRLAVVPLLAFLVGEERLRPVLDRGGLALDEPYRAVVATVTLAPGRTTVEARSDAEAMPIAPGDGPVRPPFPNAVATLDGPLLAATRTAIALRFAGFADVDLTLLPGPDGATIAEATVVAPGVEPLLRALVLRPEGWRLDGPGRLRLEAGDGDRHRYALAADLARASLPLGEGSVLATGTGLRAEGTVRLGDLGAAVPVPIPTTLTLDVAATRATGIAWPSPLRTLAVEFEGALTPAAALVFDGTTRVRTAGFGTVEANGRADLGGTDLDGAGPVELRWRWSGVAPERALAVAAELGIDPGRLRVSGGRLTAAGTLGGPLGAPVLAGKLQLQGADASLAPADDAETPPMHLALDLDSRFRWAGDTVALDDLVARTGLGTVDADASLVFGAGWPAVDAHVVLHDADGPALLAAVAAAGGPGFPAGWSVKVTPTADLRLGLDATGTLSARGAIALDGTEVASDDGAQVLQGFDTRWEVTASTSLESGVATAHGSGRTEGFALLSGGVFADYGTVGADLELDLRRDDKGRIEVGLAIDPGSSLGIEADLGVDREGPLAYRLAFTAADVDATYDRFVRGPLADSIATLAGVRAGGTGRLEVAGRWGDGERTARGAVHLEGADLVQEALGWVVRDLDLELPLDLVWGAPGADGVRPLGGPRRAGSLRVAELRVGEISFGAVDSRLFVEGDGFGLEQGLSFALLGGRFDLERATLAGLLGDGRHLQSGIRVEGVDLAELTARLGLPTLAGRLAGHFPDVRLAGDAFQAAGGGSVEVFGGRVTIGDVSGEGLFSPPLKVELSAEIAGIRLGELTRTFDVGEIQGVLDARIDDLVLFGGTPVRFHARAETVETEGVPQTITVKAIDNLAVVGTGGTFSGLHRGLLRFLDRYRYEALGAEMILDQDRFLMRGLARRGDRELFLKGRLPIRVDVVNASPGRTVSFSTMLERLRNVDVEVGENPSRPKRSPP